MREPYVAITPDFETIYQDLYVAAAEFVMEQNDRKTVKLSRLKFQKEVLSRRLLFPMMRRTVCMRKNPVRYKLALHATQDFCLHSRGKAMVVHICLDHEERHLLSLAIFMQIYFNLTAEVRV